MEKVPSTSNVGEIISLEAQPQEVVEIRQDTAELPPRLSPEAIPPNNLVRFELYNPSGIRPLKRRREVYPAVETTLDRYAICSRKSRPLHFHTKNLTDAARINGIETINHTSGVKFAIPLTMQAHPTKLTDRLPDESSDILSQHEPLPYCPFCHSVVKTWQGYEYHVMKEHIKYRPYKCTSCAKETFFTEEEGRFHISLHHPDCEVKLYKSFDRKKEDEAKKAFRYLLMMMRDGPMVTVERIKEHQKRAAEQVMRFTWLKFRTPHVVVRQMPTISVHSQTLLSESSPVYDNRRPYSRTYFPEVTMGSSSRPYDGNSYIRKNTIVFSNRRRGM